MSDLKFMLRWFGVVLAIVVIGMAMLYADERLYVTCSADFAKTNYPGTHFVSSDADTTQGILVWLTYEIKPIVDCSGGDCDEVTKEEAADFKEDATAGIEVAVIK